MNLIGSVIMASGLFVGNVLFYGLVRRKWKDGVGIGLIAASLYLPTAYFFF